MYPVNILFFPTQELVTIVKDLKGQLNEIKGMNHTRRFQTLRDELKKYCHTNDFNETVALCKCKYVNIYPLPTGLFRDNLQHWLRDFARLLKVQFTSNEGMSNDAPIHECESEIDHYTGHYMPYSLRRVCGFFNVPQVYYMCKSL